MNKVRVVFLDDGVIRLEDEVLYGDFGDWGFVFDVRVILKRDDLRRCLDDFFRSELGMSLDDFISPSK